MKFKSIVVIIAVTIFLAALVTLFVVIYPWLSVPISSNKDVEYDCVVASYKENLEWIKELPGKATIKVYSKHEDTANVFPNTVTLPNHGRCDHSYLYHIVNNYDNLAQKLLFTTGSAASLWHKKAALDTIILPRIGSTFKCIGCSFLTSKNFCIESSYKAMSSVNQNGNKIINADIRPFGAWWEHYLSNFPFPIYIVPFGVFATTREAIRKVPLETWQLLLKQLEGHDNVETGHFLERAWYRLLSL